MLGPSSSRAAIIRLVAGGCVLLSAATAAHADPGQLTWTTYLYSGPNLHYPVIDEVFQATAVDVGACGNGWCEISFDGKRGFVMSELVAKGDPSKPEPGVLPQPAASIVAQPAGPCFDVNQKGGNGGNAMTTICAK